VPGRSQVCFSFVYNNLVGILLKERYESLGILGHSLRNIIPFVGNQVESEVDGIERWERTLDYIP
jgi:hypothetical protein